MSQRYNGFRRCELSINRHYEDGDIIETTYARVIRPAKVTVTVCHPPEIS